MDQEQSGPGARAELPRGPDRTPSDPRLSEVALFDNTACSIILHVAPRFVAYATFGSSGQVVEVKLLRDHGVKPPVRSSLGVPHLSLIRFRPCSHCHRFSIVPRVRRAPERGRETD